MEVTEGDLNALVCEAVNAYNIKDGGGYNIHGFENIFLVDNVVDLVLDCMENNYVKQFADAGVSRNTVRNIIRGKCLPAQAQGTQKGFSRLKNQLKQELRNLSPLQTVHFVFPTNLRLDNVDHNFNKTFKINGTNVQILTSHIFQKTSYRSTNMWNEYNSHCRNKIPTFGVFAIIKLKSRDPQYAADFAHNTFKQLAGLFNLGMHFHVSSERWGTVRKNAVSKLTGAPYFFEYTTPSKYKQMWYSDDESHGGDVQMSRRQYDVFEAFFRGFKRYKPSEWAYAHLWTCLRVYQEAMSSESRFTAFAKFWSILEHLTFLDKKDSHLTLIKRIKGFYIKKTLIYEKKIELLRTKRNLLIHDQALELRWSDIDFIKKLAEDLINFLVGNGKNHEIEEIVFILENGGKPVPKLKALRKSLNMVIREKST